jgi:hypothetical protein
MCWVYVNTKSSLLIGIIMHAFYDGTLAALLPATLAPVEIMQFFAALNVALWVAVGIAFGFSNRTKRIVGMGARL